MINQFDLMAEKIANVYKEQQLQEITNMSIQILDFLVENKFVKDCFDTDDETEFFVQDKITEILTKNLIK
jgi:hypothetical protein